MRFDIDNLPQSVLDQLTERHLATLATRRPDGTTHLVPVGFTFEPETATARVITSGRSVKVRNVERAPVPVHAAISQVGGASWLTLEGAVRVSRDPDEIAEAVRRYALRYRTPRVNPQRVALLMQVDSIMGYVIPRGHSSRSRCLGEINEDAFDARVRAGFRDGSRRIS